eukprot:TRINITY_DN427_c0_g1_i1.p1 TRINITY_DN427_c0_g1~~TRINITY_DN427_c0_g1_i1.p1  ORF type:complete len:254 (-),score=43.35 TRINITY_DN427_c0_g1_i1:9-770(-)
MLKNLRRVPFSHLFIECIGTFFLMFTVGASVLGLIPNGGIAIGTVLMLIIFMGGYISGGHFNPAVTTAVLIRGKIAFAEALLYILVQLLGSFLASWCTLFVFGKSFAIAPNLEQQNWRWPISSALFVEFVWTFYLCGTVLHTATTRAQEGNSFFGLAIGFVVVSGAISVGDISGGAFNPAVATGPALVSLLTGGHFDYQGNGLEDVKYIWIYWLAPMLGGVFSAFAFKIAVRDREDEKQASAKISPQDDEDYA